MRDAITLLCGLWLVLMGCGGGIDTRPFTDEECARAAAQNLSGYVLPTGAVQLTWLPGQDGATELVVEWRSIEDAGWQTRGPGLPVDLSAFEDQAAPQGELLLYRVVAAVPSCERQPSSELAVYTLPIAVLGAPPSALEVQWTGAVEAGAQLHLLRSSDATSSWQEIAQPAATAQLHVDTSVEPDASYTYQLRIRSRGLDAVAGRAGATSCAFPPQDVLATPAGPHAIELSWTDARNRDSTTYALQRRVGDSGPYAPLATPASDQRVYLDESVVAGVDYQYQLSAHNGACASAWVDAGTRTSFGPQLSWDGPPALDASCTLTLRGLAEFDTERGATYTSAVGTLNRASSALQSGVDGISATLTDLQLGSLRASWTVFDDQQGQASLERLLSLEWADDAVTSTAMAAPALTLGHDSQDGRQVWLPALETNLPAPPTDRCSACDGVRGALGPGMQYHSCALTAAGRVACWGNAGYGQIGNGYASLDYQLHPALACRSGTGDEDCNGGDYLDGIVQVVGGNVHSCALQQDGQVLCWGDNEYAQLGNGGYEDSDLPAPVCVDTVFDDCQPLQGAISIAAAGEHSCALLDDGTARCWGYAAHGQLGDGWVSNNSKLATPVCVSGQPETCVPLTGIRGLAAGTDIVTYATPAYTCAVLDDSTVKCWGSSDMGQLGIGADNISKLHPVPVCASDSGDSCPPLTNVHAISAGGTHACALLDDGTLRCWGSNHHGEIGDGTDEQRLNPTPVCASGAGPDCPQLDDVIAVSAGQCHSCALQSSGALLCWGCNSNGELGDGLDRDRGLPAPVCTSGSGPDCPGLDQVAAVAAGVYRTCALMRSGRIKCWGWNGSGRLGDGTEELRALPADVCASGAGPGCAGGQVFTGAAVHACGAYQVVDL